VEPVLMAGRARQAEVTASGIKPCQYCSSIGTSALHPAAAGGYTPPLAASALL
jgi:hypothetical protein